jgi:hypothetical protein
MQLCSIYVARMPYERETQTRDTGHYHAHRSQWQCHLSPVTPHLLHVRRASCSDVNTANTDVRQTRMPVVSAEMTTHQGGPNSNLDGTDVI